MKSLIPSLAACSALVLPCSAQLVINEVRIDNGGSDSEYFELYNPDASPVDLTGYTYVVIGDGSGGDGVVEVALDLTGSSVPANGYFVAANGGSNQLSGVDTDGDTVVDISVTPDLVASLSFENSDNTTHLLVQGFTGASGDDLDADNDGTLDVTPWTNIVDAVSVLEEPNPPSSTEYAYAASLGFPEVGPDGSFLPGHVFRNGDGGSWAIGEFGSAGSNPGELTTTGDPLLDSPGITNPTVASGALSISLDTTTISEDGLTAINGTVSIGSVLGTDLAVTVAIDDETEAETFDTTIIAGDLDGFFTITAKDDLWPDGDQTVTVTVNAVNFDPANETFTVTDDDTNYTIIINEVYNDIPGAPFDANNDGLFNSDDEFVEVLNVSSNPVDLSGATLSDSSFVRHIFPLGTVLEPGCAVLVFAGAVEQGSVQFEFGDTPVQIADPQDGFSDLFLTDTGDTVTLRDALGTISGSFDAELHVVTLPDQSGAASASSITTASDGDASTGYILHTATLEGTEASPGTTPVGASYCSLSDTVGLVISPGSRTEGDGTVVNVGTVSIPSSVSSDVYVYLESSDTSEVDPGLASPVIIPVGDTSADFDLTFPDDVEPDGAQVVELKARAMGYFNNAVSITVEDDGADTPAFTDLVINEIDADTEGTDALEFIELYNKTGTVQPLTGLILVLYNGSDDKSYDVIDLNGFTIPANGYFVVGSASVPNVDLTYFTTNGLQNGADAVALIVGSAADYPNDTPVGSLTGTLVDALVYDTDDSDNSVLLAALTPGGSQINEAGGTDKDFDSISRVPDGGSSFDTSVYVAQIATPGATNVLPSNDFAAWIAGFGGVTDSSPEGTNDNDGPNILDAYFGTSPVEDDDNALSIVSQSGSDFTFRHKLAKEAVSDIEGSYVWSPNLSDWYADGADNDGGGVTVAFGTPSVIDGSDPDYDIVEVTASVTAGSVEKLFIRLEVVQSITIAF